ncbi:MAG: alpha/beta fold hydrolase [Ekhidna sp.]
MPILTTDYLPILPFRNGHISTIYSSQFRKFDPVSFTRKRINTPDDDFLDIDFLEGGNRKVVILCHGLEGSSASKYIQATSDLLHSNGYDIAAMNYRFCSGEINRQLRTYHSGKTEDLHTVIDHVLPNYDEIYLGGFSLGGNIVLKYIGDGVYPVHPKIKAVVSISVLVDLEGAAQELSKLKNRLYARHFLQTLAQKIKLKHAQYPNAFAIEPLDKVKKLIDFDDHFTSPINGFNNAKDYYAKSSSKQFLHQIETPTLVINALDDPFLSKSCYPFDEARENPHLNLMTPRYGGHVGFIMHNQKYFWNEQQILRFFEKIT